MLIYSLIFAAALAFTNLWLALRCGQIRTRDKVLHGDGGSVLLGRRMRAHSNFAEFTPIVLVLYLLVEATLGSSMWLAAAGAAYVAARIAHALGMDADHASKARMFGVMGTFLVTLALAGTALYAAWSRWGWEHTVIQVPAT